MTNHLQLISSKGCLEIFKANKNVILFQKHKLQEWSPGFSLNFGTFLDDLYWTFKRSGTAKQNARKVIASLDKGN